MQKLKPCLNSEVLDQMFIDDRYWHLEIGHQNSILLLFSDGTFHIHVIGWIIIKNILRMPQSLGVLHCSDGLDFVSVSTEVWMNSWPESLKIKSATFRPKADTWYLWMNFGTFYTCIKPFWIVVSRQLLTNFWMECFNLIHYFRSFRWK